MTQAKIISVSAVASVLYAQAQTSEVSAIVGYAFDTLTFEKSEYHTYNMVASDTLGLSLSTMRNRATAARGIQTKYGTKIAEYVDGLTIETVNEFVSFLKAEMSLAGSFHMHSEDIGNFLAGKKPGHVQRQEAKDAAEEVKRVKAETAKKKEAKDAADKAARDADMSGTTDAVPAVVPEASTVIGHAENAESVPVADMLPVAPVIPAQSLAELELAFQNEVAEFEAYQSAFEAYQAATLIRVSETADGIEIDAEKCDTETLEAVIKELQGVVKARKAELKGLLKKAA